MEVAKVVFPRALGRRQVAAALGRGRFPSTRRCGTRSVGPQPGDRGAAPPENRTIFSTNQGAADWART